MSLGLLFVDEIKGFYKSRVMAVLWIGLPFMTLILYAVQPDAEGLSFLFIVGLLVSSFGGLIGSVTLATTLSTELSHHVYDLFLIRPVKRSSLLLAKFIAVLTCILVATGLAFLTGMILDIVTIGIPNEFMLQSTLESLLLSMVAIVIACSLGLLIGVTISSVAVSTIVGIYAGGQFSAVISLVPTLLPNHVHPVTFALVMLVTVTPIILSASVLLFNRRQL
ncbi:MAG: hypothetical protein ACXAEN_23280 [Candidatus Thorarchaeota archaeon]